VLIGFAAILIFADAFLFSANPNLAWSIWLAVALIGPSAMVAIRSYYINVNASLRRKSMIDVILAINGLNAAIVILAVSLGGWNRLQDIPVAIAFAGFCSLLLVFVSWLLIGVTTFVVDPILDRIRRFPADHECARCGYDLRGTEGDRCSECGHPIAPSQYRAIQRLRFQSPVTHERSEMK